jgi:hypothetical protein
MHAGCRSECEYVVGCMLDSSLCSMGGERSSGSLCHVTLTQRVFDARPESPFIESRAGRRVLVWYNSRFNQGGPSCSNHHHIQDKGKLDPLDIATRYLSRLPSVSPNSKHFCPSCR